MTKYPFAVRTAQTQPLTYTAFVHPLQLEDEIHESCGIALASDTEEAEIFDLTPNRDDALRFLECLCRNCASPMELAALAEDFLAEGA